MESTRGLRKIVAWVVNHIYLKFRSNKDQKGEVNLELNWQWTSCKQMEISWLRFHQIQHANTWEWREKEGEQLTRRNRWEKMSETPSNSSSKLATHTRRRGELEVKLTVNQLQTDENILVKISSNPTCKYMRVNRKGKWTTY